MRLQGDTVPRMCHTLHGPVKREGGGGGRGKERSHVGARVTLLSRIEKNYHIMQIRARAQNTSGSAQRIPHGYGRSGGWRVARTDKS